jgi:transcriptional regulator with XRE-family HTH domain
MAINYLMMGKRIKSIRIRKHLSQAALSEMIGKDPTSISLIENGQRSMKLETLVELANALGVTPNDIIGDEVNNNLILVEKELANILADCSTYERRVAIDILKSLKKSMRDNFHLSRHNPK